MTDEAKKSTEESVKVVEKGKTAQGRKVVKLQKGTAEVTRLEHTFPKCQRSEE